MEHNVDSTNSFKVINKQPNSTLLKLAKAMAIKRHIDKLKHGISA